MVRESGQLDRLRRLTNIDDIVPARPAAEAGPQPMPEAPRDDVVKRSTADPLAINFAQVDIAENVAKTGVPKWVRAFAIVFLVFPSVALWFALTGGVARRIFGGDLAIDEVLAQLALWAVISAGCAFWPYVVLFKKRTR